MAAKDKYRVDDINFVEAPRCSNGQPVTDYSGRYGPSILPVQNVWARTSAKPARLGDSESERAPIHTRYMAIDKAWKQLQPPAFHIHDS